MSEHPVLRRLSWLLWTWRMVASPTTVVVLGFVAPPPIMSSRCASVRLSLGRPFDSLLFLGDTKHDLQPKMVPFPRRHVAGVGRVTCRSAADAATDDADTETKAVILNVNGLDCVPVTVTLPVVGDVTILEATADSQEILVDLALRMDGDTDDNDNNNDNNSNLEDPYGAVLWPAASAIASILVQQRQHTLSKTSILEVGTGTGLVSLAAALAGAKSVLATDYEAIPLQLLEHAARHCNHNKLDDDDDERIVHTQRFDLCDTSQPLPADYDLLVAADVMYEPGTGRCLAVRVVEALRAGMSILIGDSPGRAGRPAFLEELDRLGVPSAVFVDTVGSTVTGHRHELICGSTSTTVTKGSTPVPLTVAIMELDPVLHAPSASARSDN